MRFSCTTTACLREIEACNLGYDGGVFPIILEDRRIHTSATRHFKAGRFLKVGLLSGFAALVVLASGILKR